MKIKKVEAIRAGQFCFARIETGTGLDGIDVELVANQQDVRPPVTRNIGMRPHRDGYIVDQ